MRFLQMLALPVLLACHASNAPTMVVMGPSSNSDAGSSTRTKIAKREIEALLGHAIELRIDTRLVPKDMSEDAFIEQKVIGFGRELKKMEKTYLAAEMKRIRVFSYAVSATSRVTRTRFEGDTLSIEAASRKAAECACEDIDQALSEGIQQRNDAKFENKAPDAIDTRDLVAYRDWLVHQRGDLFEGAGTPKDRAALHLLYAVQLDAKLPNDAIVKKRIIDSVHTFFVAQDHHAAAIAALSNDAPFHRAASALSLWLTENADRLTEEQQETLVREFTGGATFRVMKGFDLVGLGLRIADEWLAKGMPLPKTRERNEQTEKFIAFVCPHWASDEGRVREYASGCLPFWSYASKDEAGWKRLNAYFASKKNGAFVQAIAPNFMTGHGTSKEATESAIAAWLKFQGEDNCFAAATRVIATQSFVGAFELRTEAIRLWRLGAAHRASALFAIATIDHSRKTSTSAEELRKDYDQNYGAKVQQNEFTDYFRMHGELAFFYAPDLLPHLEKGTSRYAAFAPMLTAYVDGSNAHTKALSRFASALCTEGSKADLAQLHAWLSTYARGHKEHETSMRALLAQTERPTCGALTEEAP
jgi:hypothetical protein